jgi:3-hydroxyisobutyrate dehydrogenase-like beta-hydroxyacid dehydrogenase
LLYVYDIKKEAGDKLIANGAIWKNSPKELMDEVDIVVTMVFGPKEIEEVMKNKDGILQSSCNEKGWIDLTTSSPSLMRGLAKEFISLGGLPVDAPVTGSLDAAIRGDMIMFVGGSNTAIENSKEVLNAIGEIRNVGRYGNGYVAKLVNNQLWKIHATAIGEAMVLAKKAGLEPDLWWEVMKGGAADSFVLQHDVPSIFAGHYDPSFRLELALKDLDLIQDLIKEHGTRSELTQACHDRFQEAADRYGNGAGEMTVCKLIEEDAEINLRVKGNWTAPWEVKHASEK